MRIAVDFDGTIVEHQYPGIGKEMLFAFETLRELQKQNHQLILWTYRCGKELEEAVEFCSSRGIEFYSVNKNYPEEVWDPDGPRKIQADVYIDDKNIGGFPGWSVVWQMLNPLEQDPRQQVKRLPGRRGGFLGRLFRGFLLLLPVVFLACQPSRKQPASEAIPASSRNFPGAESIIVSPSPGQRFTIGDTIRVELRVSDSSLAVDSAVLFVQGRRESVLLNRPFAFDFASGRVPCGTLGIRAITYYSAGKNENSNVSVVMFSDIKAKTVPYRVTGSYPHDRNAYTQGLEYRDGFIFEGTGQYNESSLRKVNLKTGEPVRVLNLPAEIFGEGITVYKGKIYQLTYKSQVGFVYDLQTFDRLQKVYYQNREGWGLTNDGQRLIMSDGTNVICFMDPEYFTETGRIEVYDSEGPVSRLNELEYIGGRIFANVYGSEEIVIIDPETGKVTGKLNMTGILPEAERHGRIDVFNGIAFDGAGKRVFVTGKYWPRLFELAIEGSF